MNKITREAAWVIGALVIVDILRPGQVNLWLCIPAVLALAAVIAIIRKPMLKAIAKLKSFIRSTGSLALKWSVNAITIGVLLIVSYFFWKFVKS